MDRDPVGLLALVGTLTKMERRVATHLAQNFGKWVTRADLVRACYHDDPTGGPDTADHCVSQFARRLKFKLPEVGLTMEGSHAGEGRRMVWLWAAQPT